MLVKCWFYSRLDTIEKYVCYVCNIREKCVSTVSYLLFSDFRTLLHEGSFKWGVYLPRTQEKWICIYTVSAVFKWYILFFYSNSLTLGDLSILSPVMVKFSSNLSMLYNNRVKVKLIIYLFYDMRRSVFAFASTLFSIGASLSLAV